MVFIYSLRPVNTFLYTMINGNVIASFTKKEKFWDFVVQKNFFLHTFFCLELPLPPLQAIVRIWLDPFPPPLCVCTMWMTPVQGNHPKFPPQIWFLYVQLAISPHHMLLIDHILLSASHLHTLYTKKRIYHKFYSKNNLLKNTNFRKHIVLSFSRDLLCKFLSKLSVLSNLK